MPRRHHKNELKALFAHRLVLSTCVALDEHSFVKLLNALIRKSAEAALPHVHVINLSGMVLAN